MMTKDQFQKILRKKSELWFPFPPDTFRLLSCPETTKEILDRVKELYSGDDDLKHCIQRTLTSDETLDQFFSRFNHFVS